MELEKINEICYHIMSFYDYNLHCKSMFTSKVFEQIENEYKDNIFKMKDEVNEETIKRIGKDYAKYPDIFNYCIVFDEKLISNNMIFRLLQKNIVKCYFNILEMNKKLNDEIILFILDQMESDKYYKGLEPYDYRYHILKRNEISEYIKEKIFKKYSKQELIDVVNDIKYNLDNELYINDINNKTDLFKNDELYNDYMTYKYMKSHIKQKVNKK